MAENPTPQTPKLPYANTVPLCDLVTSLLIIAQIPIMLGMISGPGTIGIIQWVLCGYPVLVVCVIFMIKNGQLVDATSNGILGVVLMGQNFVGGIVQLSYSAAGMAVPEEVTKGFGMISGLAFLVGGIILVFVALIAMKGSKAAGICVMCGAIALIALFPLYYTGIVIFAIICALGLFILAVFLLVVGIKMILPPKAA